VANVTLIDDVVYSSSCNMEQQTSDEEYSLYMKRTEINESAVCPLQREQLAVSKVTLREAVAGSCRRSNRHRGRSIFTPNFLGVDSRVPRARCRRRRRGLGDDGKHAA